MRYDIEHEPALVTEVRNRVKPHVAQLISEATAGGVDWSKSYVIAIDDDESLDVMVINEEQLRDVLQKNDEYAPAKALLSAPAKEGTARVLLWAKEFSEVAYVQLIVVGVGRKSGMVN